MHTAVNTAFNFRHLDPSSPQRTTTPEWCRLLVFARGVAPAHVKVVLDRPFVLSAV